MKIKQGGKQRGITLIALVVTIIVLLILAGVSISMIAGENGILGRAREASEQTEIAAERDQRLLATYEAATNISGMEFQGVPIPAGFAPTRMPGESTVEEGLVITDSEGNEFVWIPCEYDETSAAEQKENRKNKQENPIYYNNNEDSNHDNRENDWKGKQWYYSGGEWYDSQPHTIGKESIIKYGGFYVARYEAGVPEEASFYVSEKSSTLTNQKGEAKNATDKIKTLSPVSKKGNQAWNFISQTNAVTVAGNMVDNSDVKSYLMDSHAWNTICRLIENKYKEDSTKVTNSTKWGNYYNNDTTKYEKLKGLWAKHEYENGKWKTYANEYSTGLIPSNTAPKGSGNNRLELATGMCEDFKAYNIYDLAGNMWEWTTETGNNNSKQSGDGPKCYECICGLSEGHVCSEENCKCMTGGTEECKCEVTVSAPNAVFRGGSFNVGGSDHPVVDADGNYGVGSYYVNIGFRAVLYLK